MYSSQDKYIGAKGSIHLLDVSSKVKTQFFVCLSLLQIQFKYVEGSTNSKFRVGTSPLG